MIPLYDDNPTRTTPIVVIALITACVLVFLWQFSLPERAFIAAIYAYGVVPAVLFGEAELPNEIAVIPAWATVLTSMFMHGGVMHLLGNMLYLWIFGNNVEDAMGRGRFIVFYVLCGTVAALAQSFTHPGSEVPMVGASGAIAGVLGAYILLHPHANVRVLFIIIIFVRLVNVPAFIVLGIWFAGQLLSGAMTPTSDEGGVAFWAHVGGFVAGMALVPVFKRSGVPLFDKPHSVPFRVVQTTGRRGSVPDTGSGSRGGIGPWHR